MRPYDFNPAGAALRAEMRALARTMTDEQRSALAKSDPDFREALVEAKPWMSGLAPSQYALLHQQALEVRYGPRLAELEQGIKAAELALDLHGVVARALQNELTTVGGPPAPEPKPAPTPRWDLLVPAHSATEIGT